MTEPVQQTLLAVLQSILSNLPSIIAAAAAAWVVLTQANKKTIEKANETNELVADTKKETNDKIDKVHEQVNGNFTALQAKYDALVIENRTLRDQVKPRLRKRRGDP